MDNSIIDVIIKRRSIRDYKQQEVPGPLLLKLVKAAARAPSASNRQPWFFIIVNNRNVLEQISLFSPGLLGNPPNVIIICSDRKLGRNELCLMDISMAAENLMLLATEKGLGTCAVKSFNSKAIKNILELPNYISPDLIISVGYAKEEVKPPKKKNIKGLYFFNKWGVKI